MTRLVPLIRLGFRHVPGVAFTSYAFLGALVLTGQTAPVRSLTPGVYSAGQAARGQQIYKAQCAACHGNAMEGSSGPPLTGDGFLSNWSAQPLANLIGKIQKTMPFNLPGSLSKSQSIDLAAYVLQAGKFPAGQAELSEAALAQVVFPTVRSSAVPRIASGAGASLPPPEGNLAELMRAIAFPNSNIIF
ncbi:MAG: cytochrome c, partial [Acidobacteriota bacterium]